MNLNKVSLIGNLTKNPQAKKAPSGSDLSLFTVATNYIWRDAKTKEKKETVDFHSVIAWGKLAQIINKYLVKGSKVYLEGRLHTRIWEDKTKQKHYKTEIIATDLIMLSAKKGKTQNDDLAVESISIEEVPVED